MSLGRIAYTGLKLHYTLEACPFLLKYHCRYMCSSHSSALSSEYTETPNYPPILSHDKKSVYCRSRDQKLDKIKKLGTIEEKLIGINMPRFYGWNSLILNEGNFPFNILPFIQHITRTDVIEINSFPFSSDFQKTEIESIINKIRPQLQEAIILEVLHKKYVKEQIILFTMLLNLRNKHV